jgi:hypothetical protein
MTYFPTSFQSFFHNLLGNKKTSIVLLSEEDVKAVYEDAALRRRKKRSNAEDKSNESYHDTDHNQSTFNI